MAKSKETIISEIKAHIESRRGAYSVWYVGITNDKKRRVFGEHKVDRDKDRWILEVASSDKIARKIEKYFIELGCDGGDGGGDEDSVIVYAYKKSSRTDP